MKQETETSTLAQVSGIRITSIGDVIALAEHLARAKGFVPRSMHGDAYSIAAAILTGLELGIGPMEALRAIHVIDGRPTLAADYMLARAIRAGIDVRWERTDETIAILHLRRGTTEHRQTYSMRDAERAGLTRRDSWQRYPAAMLRARCVSAAMRAFCPDVLGAGIYTPDEIADLVDDRGADASTRDTAHAEDPTVAASATDVPAKVGDCRDGEELRRWCASQRGAAWTRSESLRQRAIQEIARVCVQVGADIRDALAWIGIEEA